jgi:hypothetical protein
MTNASPSAITVAARIRSPAIERGVFSIAGRLRPESVEAIARRLAPDFMRVFTEANVIATLGRFSQQYPQHFRSQKEALAHMREKQSSTVPASGVTREMLTGMSAEQRLDFANSGEIPQNFRSEDFSE